MYDPSKSSAEQEKQSFVKCQRWLKVLFRGSVVVNRRKLRSKGKMSKSLQTDITLNCLYYEYQHELITRFQPVVLQ